MGSEVDGETTVATAGARRARGHPGRRGRRPRRATSARRARGPGHHARPGRLRRPPRRLCLGRPRAGQPDRRDPGLRQPPAPTPPAGGRRPAGATASSPARRRLRPPARARHRRRLVLRARRGHRRGPGPGRRVPALDDALRLWRGPPYAEYVGEPWVEAEAVRLTELRAVARERLLEARLQLGDAAVLVGELEALVAEDPLREERWRLLVLALYRAQRQADALAALRRARETLAEELGVDPGPALRALEAEVLAQSPPWTRPAPRPRVDRRRARRRRSRSTRTDLVDRARETAALRRVVDDSSHGRRRLRARRGTGRHRQVAAARRDRAPGERGRCPRAVRAGQPAGAVLRVRGGAPAVRTVPQRPTAPRHAARRCRRGRGPVFEDGAGDDAGAARQLRRPPRPLLADREPRRRGAAGDLRRRHPVVRQRLAALPRLPRQAARGAPGAGRPRPAHRRAAPRRRAARRDRPRPVGHRAAPGPSRRGGGRDAGTGAARRRRGVLRRARATG